MLITYNRKKLFKSVVTEIVTMFEDVVTKLVRLGLREYEAKVYAALVGLGEGTARQIHEASGVPRPRVYDVLEELSMKGFVEVRHGTPVSYKAVEPSKVISKLREDFVATSQEVVVELEKLNLDSVRKASPIWYVRGRWSIKSRVEDLIERVDRELIVLCNKTDLLKEFSGKIREISYEKSVICLMVRGDKELIKQLGNADVRELVEIGDFISEVFQGRAFRGVIEVDGVKYVVEYLFIADGKESMLIYEVNGERMAISIKLPIITFIQRIFLKRIIDSSRRIV
jgi:sugar-specific transcriptional regulator TrmB